MEVFDKKPEQWKSSRQAASVLALVVGGLWSVAFLFSMYGLNYPLLGVVGYSVVLVSLVAFYNMLMNYRRFVERLAVKPTIKLALCISLYSTLILTAVQCLYFVFLDGGRFLSAMLAALEMPEMQEYLKQTQSPECTLDMMKEQIQQMTVGVITLEFFFINILLTGLAALMIGFVAGVSHVDETDAECENGHQRLINNHKPTKYGHFCNNTAI